jgi:hypothetical protein
LRHRVPPSRAEQRAFAPRSILRHADQNLHWAIWNLGQIDELRPDLPGSIVAGANAKRSPRRGALRAPSRRKKLRSR